MKFEIKGPFKENIYNLMRKIGYTFQKKDELKLELAFIRPPSGFPRFHVYLKEEQDNLLINLHLDQKKPVYKGSVHASEYETKIILEEKSRIENIIKKL